MTLYLKYRPQTLDELDSEGARETLKKIVSSGNIPHAFLFSGPKGIGKTSAARILAKIVNCESTTPALRGPGKFEPCNQCGQCISISKGTNVDVIELDAASHRGIDDVRTLRDAVKLAPANSRKKVYIIDEAHMLTTEASNALLKTLEEPPEHVMFILATTNPEKLIETIRSRCTNVIFKKANLVEVVRSLERVSREEKIKTGKEVLELIAKYSDGSFRDATKLLETVVIEVQKLERKEIEDYLFNKKAFDVEEFLLVLSKKDVKKNLLAIESAASLGISLKNITEQIITRLRSALMNKIGIEGEDLKYFNKEEIVRLIKLFSQAYSDISDSYLEQIPLELVVVEWGEVNIKNEKSNIKDDNNNDFLDDENKTEVTEIGRTKKEHTKVGVSKHTNSESVHVNGFSDETWGQILTQIKPKNSSTEALLRAARPLGLDGSVLTLGVYYRFHKERLEANPHRDILEEVVEGVLGNRVRIVCTLTEPPFRPKDGKIIGGVQSNNESNVVLPESASAPAASHSAPAASDAVLTEGEDEDIIKVAKEIFGS